MVDLTNWSVPPPPTFFHLCVETQANSDIFIWQNEAWLNFEDTFIALSLLGSAFCILSVPIVYVQRCSEKLPRKPGSGFNKIVTGRGKFTGWTSTCMDGTMVILLRQRHSTRSPRRISAVVATEVLNAPTGSSSHPRHKSAEGSTTELSSTPPLSPFP